MRCIFRHCEAKAKARAAHRAKLSDIERQDADELESAQAKADAARATVEELENLEDCTPDDCMTFRSGVGILL